MPIKKRKRSYDSKNKLRAEALPWEEESSQPHGTVFRWYLGAVLILLGFTGVGIWAVKTWASITPTVRDDSAKKETQLNNVAFKNTLRETRDAIAHAERFLKTHSLEARLQMTANVEAPETNLAAMGPIDLREATLDYSLIGEPLMMKRSGTAMLYQEVLIGSHRLPLILINQGNDWLVDYPTLAGHNNSSWDSLQKTKPLEAKVRVSLKRGKRFSPGFEDSQVWLHYELSNPNWPLKLDGYVRRKTEPARRMAAIRNGQSPFGSQATLILQRGKKHLSRTFEITEVLADNWLTPTESNSE